MEEVFGDASKHLHVGTKEIENATEKVNIFCICSSFLAADRTKLEACNISHVNSSLRTIGSPY